MSGRKPGHFYFGKGLFSTGEKLPDYISKMLILLSNKNYYNERNP
jgi:hypothetical protein